MKPYLLPDEFKDLNSFTSGWALSTEEERNKKRLASSMQEIRAFYDAVCPMARHRQLRQVPACSLAARFGAELSVRGCSAKFLPTAVLRATPSGAVGTFVEQQTSLERRPPASWQAKTPREMDGS